ncbi:putative Polyprotein [Phytophthora cinnamomi]|uniref:putative Polyprotein n=1 Tax=Phytophthora cinnamomi TaxID=4785 RepID=UPI00355ABDE3|nr:putative Polyprotein [Phytophthora cinnamomi]
MGSSGVAISAADEAGSSGDGSDEEASVNNREHRGGGRQPDVTRPSARSPRAAQPNQREHDAEAVDDLEDMNWCDALTPGQQRSMMRRFIIVPPAAATVAPPPVAAAAPQPQPIIVPMERPKARSKKLLISDFHGKAD